MTFLIHSLAGWWAGLKLMAGKLLLAHDTPKDTTLARRYLLPGQIS